MWLCILKVYKLSVSGLGKIFTGPMFKFLLSFTVIFFVYRSCLPNETTFTKYCLTQWISKLPGSFEIQWVKQYLHGKFPKFRRYSKCNCLQDRANFHRFITMTSQWPRRRLKSPASRLFTQSFIQIKENIKAPRHWPLCGEFTGTGEFPAQMASNAENVSISWRHHGVRISYNEATGQHVIVQNGATFVPKIILSKILIDAPIDQPRDVYVLLAIILYVTHSKREL